MSQDRGQARWQALWQSRGPKARLLLPVALLYRALSAMRRSLYLAGWLKVERMPVPVVVIGNVVVGGAGKTPTVLALIHHLQSQGWRPGVVSRGYGRKGIAPLEVRPDTPPEDSGDEPALIGREAGVPVFVARRRADAAKALLDAYPDVNILLCDDGLQHLALARDLAIAVFDDRGTGNGWLLPAGLLREAWPPHQHTAFAPDIVLQQTSKDTGALPQLGSHLPTFRAHRTLNPLAQNALGQTAPLKSLVHHQLAATAGIARPEAFFEMLRHEGVSLSRTIALPDHADAEAYVELVKHLKGPLLCTEKDAVKLFPLVRQNDRPDDEARQVWSVRLNLAIEAGFFEAVDAHLARLPARKTVRPSH